ncbi:MAG: hypothetical protein ACFHU9_10510 [Fluviicola sp.]
MIPILLIPLLFILLIQDRKTAKLKKGFLFYALGITLLYCVQLTSLFKNKERFSMLNSLDVTGFYYLKVDNGFYHGYFEPVGSNSGGEGNVWITETPAIFPLIEKPVYKQHAVTWNYATSKFENKKINQRTMMRQTIIKNIRKQ